MNANAEKYITTYVKFSKSVKCANEINFESSWMQWASICLRIIQNYMLAILISRGCLSITSFSVADFNSQHW